MGIHTDNLRMVFPSTTPHLPPPQPPRPVGEARRLFWRWWRQQSPNAQDRYATLGPLVSVMLFLAAIIVAFWYLRNEELEREQESVKRDTEVVQQQIRLRLIENQEQLLRLAREISIRAVNPEQFMNQAADFVRARPEVLSVSWVQADERIKASQSGMNSPLDPSRALELDFYTPQPDTFAQPLLPRREEPRSAFRMARERSQPVYSQAYQNTNGLRVVQVHVPLIDRSGFVGTLVAEYSLDSLMRFLVPREIAARHAMSLIQINGQRLTSAVNPASDSPSARPTFMHEVIVTPVGNGLLLRGEGFKTSSSLIGNTLFWMVVALSGFTVWTLLGTLQHMRRRTDIQKTLVQETNFRRAMENSMLTGMRTIDLEGRITYVNPAFCAMTGFSEQELLGCTPPYPYWPKDRLDEFNRMFQQELLGRSPTGGLEVVVQRRDGSTFDARMYVSPLIDAQGDQTGWMTSVTNITEAKRVRDQLSAAHERFTTVLEGLDAAVSVVSVQQNELLFANRSYRLWFGGSPEAHMQLTGGDVSADIAAADSDDSVDSFGGLPTQHLTDAGGDAREAFVDSVQKWFDVRARYIQWTDGRLAQMLIATDITERREGEEAAARQAEKAQFTSRLITMGEMASTVAHELNQPLTAVLSNSQAARRLLAEDPPELDAARQAMGQAAEQAKRASAVVGRLRRLVEQPGLAPQAEPLDLNQAVAEALYLLEPELRRRQVQVMVQAADLPAAQADPVAVQQILHNLLVNALQAMDEQPPAARHLRVKLARRDSRLMVAVHDSGPGVAPEMRQRLFTPFATGRAQGLGLGLTLSQSLAESMGGSLELAASAATPPQGGARFELLLPAAHGPAPAAPNAPQEPLTP